jgi:hypothetical protein
LPPNVVMLIGVQFPQCRFVLVRLEMAQENVYSILLLRICVRIIVVTLKGPKELLRLGRCLPLSSLLTEDLSHEYHE